MARRVNAASAAYVRGRTARAWLALALLAVSAPLLALDDPTRPPPGLSGKGGSRRAAADDGLVLQSVIISQAQRSAIISGEHVMLGGRIGAARLVKVSEAAVVLLIGSTQRRLELFPSVHKHTEAAGE